MSSKYKNAMLPEGSSIMEAIKIIDASSLQIVLVVDSGNRLIGTITDGDIRRGILRGISLEEKIESVMNTKPCTVVENTPRDEVLRIMTERKIHQIPVVADDGQVVDLKQLDELAEDTVDGYDGCRYECVEDRDKIPVVLMLGGQGSRLLPLTREIPKPMIHVGGRPLLEIIVENFVSQGFRNFYFSVNYKSDVIKEHFGDGSGFGACITYLNENRPMGTAGALSLLPERPDSPMVVMNGDILTNCNFSHLIGFHRQNSAAATMCVREHKQQVPYGIVKTRGTKLHSIVEKPSQTYFVNAGIYVIEPEVLDYVPKDRYLDMPDLFNMLGDSGLESAVFPIREYWKDIGNINDLESSRTEYSRIFKSGKA